MRLFIKVENEKPLGQPITEANLKTIFPNHILPEVYTPENIKPYGFAIYRRTSALDVTYPLKNVELSPVLKDGIYYQNWQQLEMSEDEKNVVISQKSEEIRKERNYRLSACDWTQNLDNKLTDSDKKIWLSYRQSLRDITLQTTFPFSVTWPVPPNYNWQPPSKIGMYSFIPINPIKL